MGFLKTITTDFGVNVTYWNIKCTWINWQRKFLHIQLQGFINQAAVEANPQQTPLVTYTYNFEGNDFFITYSDNVLQKCYDKLKTMSDWSDATDSPDIYDIFDYSRYSGYSGASSNMEDMANMSNNSNYVGIDNECNSGTSGT